MPSPSAPERVSRHRHLLVVPLLLLLSRATSAGAVPVRGVATIEPPSETEASAEEPATSRDHYWDVWDGELDPIRRAPDPRRELAVVLVGESERRGIDCVYAVEGGDLLPKTFVMQTGARTTIENHDGTTHRLFARGLDSFSSQRTAPGRERALRAPAPGRWEIGDTEYQQLSGHLVTIPDLVACARVTTQGTWTFADVPPGDYTLKVYRAGEEAHSEPIRIPNRPRGVTVPPITLPGN